MIRFNLANGLFLHSQGQKRFPCKAGHQIGLNQIPMQSTTCLESWMCKCNTLCENNNIRRQKIFCPVILQNSAIIESSLFFNSIHNMLENPTWLENCRFSKYNWQNILKYFWVDKLFLAHSATGKNNLLKWSLR